MQTLNFFKEAERVLASRRDLECAKGNLERRRDCIIAKSGPTASMTQDYSKPYVSSGQADDSTSICLELAEVNWELTETVEMMHTIDTVLNQLTPIERQVLMGWYIEKVGKERLAEILEYDSVSSVYNLRNKAVSRFSVLFFGAGALSSI